MSTEGEEPVQETQPDSEQPGPKPDVEQDEQESTELSSRPTDEEASEPKPDNGSHDTPAPAKPHTDKVHIVVGWWVRRPWPVR